MLECHCVVIKMHSGKPPGKSLKQKKSSALKGNPVQALPEDKLLKTDSLSTQAEGLVGKLEIRISDISHVWFCCSAPIVTEGNVSHGHDVLWCIVLWRFAYILAQLKLSTSTSVQ